MTHSEAHIILDQKFDKIGTDKYDDLLVEEKDLWLNEGLTALIKERTKPQPYWDYRFEETKPQYDNFENLVTTVDIPLYILDNSTMWGNLPHNYLMAISEEVYGICGSTPDTKTVDLPYFVMPFPPDNRLDRNHNYFANLRIAVLKSLGFVYDYIYSEALHPKYQNGVSEKELYYMIVKHFLERQEQANTFGYQIYWEWYNGKYHPNSLIIVNGSGEEAISAWWFYSEVVGGTIPITEATHSQYDIVGTNFVSEARLVRHERLRNTINNSLFTTSYDSPIATFDNHLVKVHHNSKFYPDRLKLTYLRKPFTIDYKSDTFAEIDVQYHNDLINKTVEMLTAALVAENHQIIAANNITNE